MTHELVTTERHIVLIARPAMFDLEAARAGQSILQWQPSRGMRIAVNYESKHRSASELSVEQGLTIVGPCVAGATPQVDDPATVHTEMAENISL